MSVPAFLMRALYLHMRDEGLALEDVFGGLDGQADPARASADFRSLSDAMQAAFACGAGPDLALQMGATTPLHALGMFGELLSRSATLRDAIAATRRFLPLLQAGGEIRLVETGNLAIIHFEPGVGQEPERRFAIELSLSMMVTVGRHFLGKATNPRQILLPHSAPKYYAEYDRLFRCPVIFEAGSAALLCDRALLDVRQPLADEYLGVVLEAELERAMRCELPRGPLYARVRAILERDSKLLSQDTLRILPRRLGLTPRAVRRRLAAEGLTLSGLVRDFRKQQAIHLVVEMDLPLKSIADKMGFSDSTSFHRAFKRWTGATPKEFRRRSQLSASAA